MRPTKVYQPPFTTRPELRGTFGAGKPHPPLSGRSGHARAGIGALRERGHNVTVEGPWSLGRVCAVGRDADKLSAAATPRLMQAYAIAR